MLSVLLDVTASLDSDILFATRSYDYLNYCPTCQPINIHYRLAYILIPFAGLPSRSLLS